MNILPAPYVTPIIEALQGEMDIDSPLLARLYALLVLAKGTETTMEDAHDAWSLWCLDERADHFSLVPFDQLRAHVQEFDRTPMNLIHRVAKRFGLA